MQTGNGLLFPGSFLARTTSQAMVAKFLRQDYLFEGTVHSCGCVLLTYIHIYIYKLTVERQRPLFCNKALTKQLKEYETQLISLYMYSNSAITETE